MKKLNIALYLRLEGEMKRGDLAAARKTVMEIYDLQKETGYIDVRLIKYAKAIEEAEKQQALMV